MPAYNAAATLLRSMHSVLHQTEGALELIVVDDGSTDATARILEATAEGDPRIVPIRQPRNAGVAAARNTGIEAARGDYIAFLDSDDRWSSEKLAVQLEQMRSTGTAISYGSYRRVDGAGRVLSVVEPPARIRYADMLRSNHIGNLTGMYDRRIGDGRFERIGHEDYVFWMGQVRRSGEARRVVHPSPVADYLVRGDSLSADKLQAARWQWNVYRRVEGLGWWRAAWYFANYAAIATVKRYGSSVSSTR
jgi:glycosyltransferase involved in cell wall biosynthesis